MSGSVIYFKDLLVRGRGEGFLESFGSGVAMDRIARRLTSLAIAACNLFWLWVETEMFRDRKEGGRLRGFMGLMWNMMCPLIVRYGEHRCG